ADFAAGGWEGPATTLVSVGGTFGVTVGSDAVVGECMTAAGAFEPSGRRWALSAIRPSVSTAPTTRKYFKISITRKPRHQNLVARRACGVHLQPYADTAMDPFSRAKAEIRAAFARHERGGPRSTQPPKWKTRLVMPLRGWHAT